MKTKFFLSVGVAALISLSFTFISLENKSKKDTIVKESSLKSEPAGGFASQDKL
jgi:hypothetical protein